MDEGVRHGMDARLGRHFDLAIAFFLERLFEKFQDGGHIQRNLLNIGARKVKHLLFSHLKPFPLNLASEIPRETKDLSC